MHPSIALMLSNPRTRAALARGLAQYGRGGDSQLAHVNPAEAAMLKRAGGSGTINPRTGLPEYKASQGGGSLGGGGFGGAGIGGSGAGRGGAGGPGFDGMFTGQYRYLQNQPRPAAPAPTTPTAPTMIGAGNPSLAPVMMPAPGAQLGAGASPNLIGNAYGAVPAWALQGYQLGTQPTSYAVPWVGGSAPLPTTSALGRGLGTLGTYPGLLG